MSVFKGLAARTRSILRPGDAEARLDEEFRFHLETETEQLIRQGVPPAEARRRALVAFGAVEGYREAMRDETGDGFPEKVTAFRDGMAVHGRYGRPCPACGAPIQRIVYARNEANYCATCQTGGRLLSDRALSRLLKQDWPKTLEDMERKKERLKIDAGV